MNIYQHRNDITAPQIIYTVSSQKCAFITLSQLSRYFLLLLSSLNSYEIIEKELTVQVTSKRSCVCCSQLSGTNWAYVDHVQPKPYPSPPPPPPICLQSLTRDTKGAGVEGVGVAVGHLLPPSLRLNSLTALIHQTCQRHLSHLMGHPSLERTPLSEPQSQRCPCFTTTELGGGGGVPRRGD
jgi:hypothetical protein